MTKPKGKDKKDPDLVDTKPMPSLQAPITQNQHRCRRMPENVSITRTESGWECSTSAGQLSLFKYCPFCGGQLPPIP